MTRLMRCRVQQKDVNCFKLKLIVSILNMKHGKTSEISSDMKDVHMYPVRHAHF